MKVVKFLEWMLKQGISSESVSIVDVPRDCVAGYKETADFIDAYFQGIFAGTLTAGKYAYFYTTNVKGSDISELARLGVTPDCLVFVDDAVVLLYLIDYNLEP